MQREGAPERAQREEPAAARSRGHSFGVTSAQQSLSTVRERVVDTAVLRTRSLLQVGSKVAQELKNPLAAVKSLLQLEAEAIAAGHDGEGSRLDAE
jgi:hypothetical protein